MHRRRHLCLALVLGVAAAGHASAQTTLNLGFSTPNCPTCSDTLLTIDLEGRRILRATTLGRASAGTIYVTPEGRLTLWQETISAASGQIQGVDLRARDNVTGADIARLALSPFTSGFVGNPTRPEVYISGTNRALALSGAGSREFATTTCGTLTAAAVSGNGQRTAFRCAPGSGFPDIAIFDTVSGALLRTLPGGAAAPVFSADGLDLYQVDVVGGGQSLRRYSVDSGTILGETVVSVTSAPAAFVFRDPRTGRLVVFAEGAATRVFDPTTLTEITTVPQSLGGAWTFDPARPRAYALHVVGDGSGATFNTTLNVIDSDTFQLVEAIPVPLNIVARSLNVVPRPAAPTLAATVQGARVQLSWTPGDSHPSTTRYLVEIGSASGRNDIFAGLDVGLQNVLIADPTPSGTYYVRVRAANVTGSGLPSNEVVVTIP